MSEGWRLGGHRVTSLDDISKYSDSMLSSFQSLKDGRSEAHFDGLKSESEIASQCVDERMVGLERMRFFLFAKQATVQQRIVGIESISKECTVWKPVGGGRGVHAAASAATVDASPACAFVSDESSAARSVEGAFAYAAALSSTPAGCPVMPAALPGSGSSSSSTAAASSVLVLSDDGARLLETLLPELQRAVPQWEWDMQTRVASLYCDWMCAPPFEPGHPPGLLPRARILEPIVMPFLCRMLDQEEMSEEYLSVWMQPMMAAIDSLGASAPGSSSPVAPSAMLSTTLLNFSLKQSKDYLLSQPINVRILCVHLLGALSKHLHWRTILSRVLDSVLALCQDTSGAVRFHMCRQIVHVLQAISPLAVHARHAGTSGGVGNHSSCKDCPPPLVVGSDGSLDPSHPLVLLLAELEELLKDEERDCKIRAFQSLVSTLDIWPDPLRRGRVAMLVQKFIQVPPGRGMMMLIAQNLAKIVWQIRGDWWSLDVAATAATGASSPSSAASAASSTSHSPSSDVALHHLVKTLIAFYKNLPFLSQSNNGGGGGGGQNGNGSSSLTASSSNGSSGSGEAQMLSPVSAAMLAHSRSESASSLPLSPSNAFSSLYAQGVAQLCHEPRRCCAASFVAVASILGRVGAASAGPSAAGSAAAAASSPSSPQPLLPETRFFIDHLSSLWCKLLKADGDTAASSAAGSHSGSSAHGSSGSSGGGDATGSDEVRLTLIMSFWEVVNILSGVGSSLTRGVVAEANAAAIAAATAHQQMQPQQVQFSPQSSPSHAMRKSSSTHGLAPGVVPLPAHLLPLAFQTAATAATTLHSTSAFKLTKDVFLSILHEHSHVHAAAPQSGAASSAFSLSSSSAASSGSNRPLAILTTAAGLTTGHSGGGSSLQQLGGGGGGGGSGGGGAESFLYLIEGGKLESIMDAYYRNHFGSVSLAASTTATPSPGSLTAYGVSDAVADSWSSLMHDFLRGLLGFESCVLSASASSFSSASSSAAVVAWSSSGSVYNWRHKVTFWASVEFLARHPTMHTTSSNEMQPPRGYTSVRPAYLSHLPQLHSASDLNNLALFLDRIISAAFHGMHTGPAPLKLLLSRIVTHVMLFAPLAYRRLEAVQRFLREFAFSRSYWDRLLFVQVCQRLMGIGAEETDAERSGEEEDGETHASSRPAAVSSPPSLSLLLCSRPCSQRLFKKFFMLSLLTLLSDPVSSIRLQFTTACPRMLPTLKRMLRLPGDQACVDAFTKGLASLKSAVLDPSSDRDTREGTKLMAVARANMEQFKAILTKLEGIEVARGPAGGGASHPPSPSAAHFSFSNAATATALTAAQLFEHGERRREAFEDSLLRIEESWIADERHRAALSHSGGNLAAASAALAAASNWTPQSFEAKPAAPGGSPNLGPSSGAAATGSTGESTGSKVASTTAIAAKAKRASQTGTNLKAMQDAVSDAAAHKQRKAGGTASAASSSATGSSAQAHQAAALAASRVAAANKRNMLPGSAVSALSSSAASSSNASASANSAASSSVSSAPMAAGTSNAAATGAPKSAVRRYGSVPASSFSSGAAAVALAPSSTSIAASASVPATLNTPAASVASILAVKNHARNTVETLLNRPVSGAAPSTTSLGLPPPAGSLPLGARREYDSKAAGYELDDGPLAAAAPELRPRRFAPVSTSSPAQSQSLARVTSASNASVPSTAAVAGRRSVAGAAVPAGSAAASAPSATPLVAPVAVVSMRSSKLLSANLSVSAARIVASAGANSGATSSSPVLGGSRSGSPIVGGVRPGRAALGRLPSQSTNTAQHHPLPSHDGTANGGSLSDRSNDSSSSAGSSHGTSGSSGVGGHHHSISLTHLSAAALLQLASEQRQATSHGQAAAMAGRRQQAPTRSTGAASPSLPVASTGAASSATGSAPLLPKLDGSSVPKLYSREPLAHAHLRKFKASNRASLPTADELRSERHAIKAAEEAAAAAAAASSTLTASGAPVHRRSSLSGDSMAAATSKLGPKSSPRK